jgi:hypothetical protein
LLYISSLRPPELGASLASVAFWDFAMTEGSNFLTEVSTRDSVTWRHVHCYIWEWKENAGSPS